MSAVMCVTLAPKVGKKLEELQMKMKMSIVALVCALALGFTAPSARASITNLTFGDIYYIGHINDSVPSDLADELGYINNLITLSKGQAATPIGSETYDRIGSTLVGPFSAAILTGATKTNTSVGTGIDATGFTYLLAKYDAHNAGGYVWLVSGLTDVTVPNSNINDNPPPAGYGLSHYSLYNPGTSVPDGGVTLMLLGGALVGIETLRRRFRA
jgi:hypothetical protein